MLFIVAAIALSIYLCIGLCTFDWTNKRSKALRFSLEIASLTLFGAAFKLQGLRYEHLNGICDGGSNLQLFLCTHGGVQFIGTIELTAIILQIIVFVLCLKTVLMKRRKNDGFKKI